MLLLQLIISTSSSLLIGVINVVSTYLGMKPSSFLGCQNTGGFAKKNEFALFRLVAIPSTQINSLWSYQLDHGGSLCTAWFFLIFKNLTFGFIMPRFKSWIFYFLTVWLCAGYLTSLHAPPIYELKMTIVPEL